MIIEGNPEMYIVSDPNHLQTMLENIVENALRFSPADQPVILKIWRDSTTNYIQVKDFGTGIPLEEREKVFEPFVRLESLTASSPGHGARASHRAPVVFHGWTSRSRWTAVC